VRQYRTDRCRRKPRVRDITILQPPASAGGYEMTFIRLDSDPMLFRDRHEAGAQALPTNLRSARGEERMDRTDRRCDPAGIGGEEVCAAGPSRRSVRSTNCGHPCRDGNAHADREEYDARNTLTAEREEYEGRVAVRQYRTDRCRRKPMVRDITILQPPASAGGYEMTFIRLDSDPMLFHDRHEAGTLALPTNLRSVRGEERMDRTDRRCDPAGIGGGRGLRRRTLTAEREEYKLLPSLPGWKCSRGSRGVRCEKDPHGGA
jgi:hypothetical protein